MIPRTSHVQHVHAALRTNPVVGVLGARQVGKTTLAQQIVESYDGPSVRFDLEDPGSASRELI